MNRILDHPDIRAVAFVGSNATGRHVLEKSAATNKRVQVCSHPAFVAVNDRTVHDRTGFLESVGGSKPKCSLIEVARSTNMPTSAKPEFGNSWACLLIEAVRIKSERLGSSKSALTRRLPVWPWQSKNCTSNQGAPIIEGLLDGQNVFVGKIRTFLSRCTGVDVERNVMCHICTQSPFRALIPSRRQCVSLSLLSR